MSFSEHFLNGLYINKSDSFQNEFFDIMNSFEKIFDYDLVKLEELEDLIESKISYNEKGTLLARSGLDSYGGDHSGMEFLQDFFSSLIEQVNAMHLDLEERSASPKLLLIAVKCRKEVCSSLELGLGLNSFCFLISELFFAELKNSIYTYPIVSEDEEGAAAEAIIVAMS